MVNMLEFHDATGFHVEYAPKIRWESTGGSS